MSWGDTLNDNNEYEMYDTALPEIIPAEEDIWSANYVKIPRDIIQEYDDPKLVAVYIFFILRAGLDHRVRFTINDLVTCCGFKPNNHKGKTNDKIICSIKTLCDIGYISLLNQDVSLENVSGSKVVVVTVNQDCIDSKIEEIKNRPVVYNIFGKDKRDGAFAILYVDEIYKILSYEIKDSGAYVNNASLLLVLAYLRSMIYLKADPFSKIGAEAYYDYYYDIADRLGMTVKSFSALAKILYKDLKLIYYRHIRKKLSDGSWVTLQTVFCNTYRRNGIKIIRCGWDYYFGETQIKMEMMGEDWYFKKASDKQLKQREKDKNIQRTDTDEVYQGDDWFNIV